MIKYPPERNLDFPTWIPYRTVPDQGFQRRGVAATRWGTYYLAIFSRKLHEKLIIFGRGWCVSRTLLDPPLQEVCWQYFHQWYAKHKLIFRVKIVFVLYLISEVIIFTRKCSLGCPHPLPERGPPDLDQRIR